VARRCRRPIAGTTLLLALAVAASFVLSPLETRNAPGGWGAEALAVDATPAWSPIAAANACGMGASSCFKCHNGSRAPAPKADKQTAPWHIDHKTVNHSCAGCHKGNARLIKQELAHKDLVKDPRTDTQTCATCHKGGNVAELVKTYQR
jgi:hypothetical protein